MSFVETSFWGKSFGVRAFRKISGKSRSGRQTSFGGKLFGERAFRQISGKSRSGKCRSTTVIAFYTYIFLKYIQTQNNSAQLNTHFNVSMDRLPNGLN
jgi:hypothetical protein